MPYLHSPWNGAFLQGVRQAVYAPVLSFPGDFAVAVIPSSAQPKLAVAHLLGIAPKPILVPICNRQRISPDELPRLAARPRTMLVARAFRPLAQS